MNPVGDAAYTLGYKLGQVIVGGGNNADKAAEQAIEHQRIQQELARERAIEEQKRQEMFDRLNGTLKGIAGDQRLHLKGLGSDSTGGTGSTSSAQMFGGLKLKLGNNSSAVQNDECAGKSWGIPGLPGVYLNYCHQPSLWFPNTPGAPGPVEVAQAAQNLSGPAREVVEQAVLSAAENNPALTTPSQDPNVVAFQQADQEYQQAVQAQDNVNQQFAAARTRVDDDQNVLDVVNSKFDKATASAAQQAALAQMAAAAKSDEEASSMAKQGFDTVAAKTSVARTQAVKALAAVNSKSMASDAVDLTHARQPLVAQIPIAPQGATSKAGPVGQSTPLPTTVLDGSVGLAAPGKPIVDCYGDRAAVKRLSAGLPVQDDAIKRTESALNSAISDRADARTEVEFAAIKTLNSAAVRMSNGAERLLAREEGLKSAGIQKDAAARFKLLEQMKKIAELSSDLADATSSSEKLQQSYKAGTNFGNEEFVVKTAHALSDQIEATSKLLVDSGIYDELVKNEAPEEAARTLAGFFFGPIGEADVELVISGTDLLLAGTEAMSNTIQARKAERNLDLMRIQHGRVQQRIAELEREIAGSCALPAGAGLSATVQ